MKNMPDSIFFTLIAELNLKFSSRFLRQRDACGMEISIKNRNVIESLYFFYCIYLDICYSIHRTKKADMSMLKFVLLKIM